MLAGAKLPPCPACGGELRRTPIVSARKVETRIAPGTDTTEDMWHVTVRCPGCDVLVRLEQFFDDWSASVERP